MRAEESALWGSRRLAEHLGIFEHAVALARDADFLDLHIDSFIPARLFGDHPNRHHERRLFGGRFFSHLDFPRARIVGLDGGMWSITTNPFRTEKGRWRAFLKNLSRLRRIVEDGRSSTPLPATRSGFTEAGRALVASLNERRVFVDLAHIHPTAFWQTVEAHDKRQPLLVTHTGVSGVTPSWRNVHDDQIRAIADTGGILGIIFHEGFLKRPGGPTGVEMVLEPMEHVIRVAGEDFVSVSTDDDGAIVPPRDLRDGIALPRLVEGMLKRGWSEERIRKARGGNFLRAFQALRP